MSLLLCPLWPLPTQAQATGIIPNVTVEPGIVQTSQTTSAVVSVTNVGGSNTIANGDRFSITFNTTLGTVTSVNPQVFVSQPSPSGFTPLQFLVQGPTQTGEVAVTYVGPNRTFVAGDSFSVHINFTSGSLAGQGVVLVNLTAFSTPIT
ncbi:MAG: hypothetical protein WAQ98_18000, partial [Blastocatellia bacterium]